MFITSPNQLTPLLRIGSLVANILSELQQHAIAGMTTLELDTLAADRLRRAGARSTPQILYQFPATLCISVNSEAVHGLPRKRVLQIGDVVKIDLAAELDGYLADAARTVVVGDVAGLGKDLAECARSAFAVALQSAWPGQSTREIGRRIECEVKRLGYEVLRAFCGHGLGPTLHEPPCIPNYDEPAAREVLLTGMVVCIEPVITAGRDRVLESSDGWTIGTADGCLSAHYEDTIVITPQGPIVVTQSESAR
jgi:methionyl aminopeptidase